MSGFRNFSTEQMMAQTKTLKTIDDEDDWRTEDNNGNNIHNPFASNNVEVSSQPNTSPSPNVSANMSARDLPQEEDWLSRKLSNTKIGSATATFVKPQPSPTKVSAPKAVPANVPANVPQWKSGAVKLPSMMSAPAAEPSVINPFKIADMQNVTPIKVLPHEENSVEKESMAGKFVKQNMKTIIFGHSEDYTHTINDDEKQSFTNHINMQLADKSILNGKQLPIDSSSMELFDQCKDGLILASLINESVPNTIDERVLNKIPSNGKSLSIFQMTENNNIVVNSAKAIGCSVVNIGSEDVVSGRAHLILGLIWQILRIGVQSTVDIKVHPELFRLLEPGELLEDFLKLPVETILLRWFNYHLKNAGANRRVSNFSSDLMDSENYVVLLNQLAPHACPLDTLGESDLYKRADKFLMCSDKVGCYKYLTPKTLVEGNAKLNFLFVANLFNELPGLDKLSESELENIGDQMFDSEGDREARAFALWLNSLGVDPFVNYLFDDIKDGLILLQAIDKVHPGMVDWKKVNKPNNNGILSKFKAVENTNYAVYFGKDVMKFSLVGIQGSDIYDGNRTLSLSLVWQLMREHIVQVIKTLSSSSGAPVTEEDMIRWANDTCKGSNIRLNSFRDAHLSNSVFFAHLLNGIKPGSVDMKHIAGISGGHLKENDKLNNAMYVISAARKLGATIFVLPEDIVEVKPKMILTFIGTLMSIDKSMK